LNLFLVGRSRSGPIEPEPARGTIRDLAARLPFPPEVQVRLWSSPDGSALAACVSHDPEQLGGVRYAHFDDDRMALFAGRPIQWVDETACDGRVPLDPRHYLRPPDQWVDGLDGRCAVARWDHGDGALEIYTDPQGCYPVFWTEVGPVRWASNSAKLLSTLGGNRGLRRSALAALLGCDHSLDGEAWWEGVHRVPRGAVWRLDRDGRIQTRERLPFSAMAQLFGSGFEPGAAAGLITAAVAALGDWPGRPSVIPVTAGRDSRTILAAARRAGLPVRATTVGLPWASGWPETEDVRRGRAVCRRVGVEHERITVGPRASVFEDPAGNARTVALVAPVPVCQYDAMTLPPDVPPGLLEIVHMGLGGEFARTRFGLGDGLDRDGLVRHLTDIAMPRPPEPLLSADGRRLVSDTVRAHVDEYLAAGVRPVDLPDVFYLNNHMAPWGGGVQGAHEYVQDTVSAMWAWRLLGQEWGLPAQGRERNLFQLRVLPILSPELMREPFQGNPWPDSARPRVVRMRHVAGVLAEELRLRRRSHSPDWEGRGPMDLFAQHLEQVREHVAGHPHHPAWDVLDRRRVERRLRRPAALWDRRSRAYAWRLGTVFMGDLES
jgi:hypothetical protein